MLESAAGTVCQQVTKEGSYKRSSRCWPSPLPQRFDEGQICSSFSFSEPLSTPSQPRNFSIALKWCQASDHRRGVAGAREHSPTSGQPICCGSSQHLLLAGSSSWALQGAELRLIQCL